MTAVTSACRCVEPIPVVHATRKGAAKTECARCGQPLALRLTGSRSAA